jgi:hypothetical protein
MGKTREGEGEGQEDDSDDEDLLGADFGKAAADAGNASDYENEDGGFSPRAMSPEPMSPRGGTPEGDRSFSPEAIRAREDEPDYLDVVDEDEDRRELTRLRAAQKSKKLGRFKEAAGPGATAGATERATFDAFKEGAREAAASHGAVIQNLTADAGEAVEHRRAQEERSRAMAERMMGDGSGEVAFAGEAPLESQVYWWHDKYRPRKPKYFNRVHTGYEWNKYNQTHYDHDNPPPKTVQGYKFNIFYPDLIDKSKAPTYTIMPDGSKHGETCILRIHAGPPYEDIAFKVVNKEWEYASKKGFRCSFERGIFHLYINFKRARYRR